MPQQIQYQAVNDSNQSPNHVRFVQNQTQMVQLPRQMSPMGQQRPAPHMQMKQVSGPQTMIRMTQQTQGFPMQTNQDQAMHDTQPQSSIRMMSGPQIVQMRDQNPQVMMNMQQSPNGSTMVRTLSSQPIVFQQPSNQVELSQRSLPPAMHGEVMVLTLL